MTIAKVTNYFLVVYFIMNKSSNLEKHSTHGQLTHVQGII